MRKLAAVSILFVGAIALVAVYQSAVRQREEAAMAASHPKSDLRRIVVKRVEDNLLRAGFDVQVAFVKEDDSEMVIYGKSVDRPFSRNLIAEPSFRSLLRTAKFREVTFMDSMTFPGFVGSYDVTAAPQLGSIPPRKSN